MLLWVLVDQKIEKMKFVPTLNEMKYRQTPDLSVDLISSSRWSRMIPLIYSYQAKISVISPILQSLTFTLKHMSITHHHRYSVKT